MDYLECEKCGGYYELQPGENPEDFDLTCNCGGKFHVKNNEKIKNNGSTSLKLNWIAMVIAFIITLILNIFAFSVAILGFLSPLIGGFVAGYLIDGNFRDGAVNGAIPTSLAGFIASFIILAIYGFASTYTGYTGSAVMFLIFIAAIIGLIMGGVFGLLGGIIGVFIKNR